MSARWRSRRSQGRENDLLPRSRKKTSSGQSPCQCHVRGTVKTLSGGGLANCVFRRLWHPVRGTLRLAGSLANCVVRRLRQPVESVAASGGVRRLRLLQPRTWPSAPIPSATGRPQKICLSRSRSPTPRVSLSIANCTPTADVTPRRVAFLPLEPLGVE